MKRWLMLTNAAFFSTLLKITQLKSMDLLLKIYFDDELKFNFHIEELCKNAERKLHALARVTLYMELLKKRILMNAFSQFDYCPLICMCHSRKIYHKINRLHGKWLRIIYNDKTSPYEELLSKDGSVSMHLRICKNLL